ncbi:MAG: bifunctional homocysteine S-methyltransferase/methylenetetrahydrofolate reductase [Spirochaetota bacterium]
MMRKPYLERLRDGVLLFDGAMGTMLYEKGIFVNQCFEHTNLTAPDVVLEIHSEMAAAGAQVLTTNSFGANPIRLASYSLQHKTAEINQKSVELARSVAGEELYVAGSVGPLGMTLAPVGSLSKEAAAEAFAAQMKALVAAGVDLLILETFKNLEELLLATRTARELAPELPIQSQFSFRPHRKDTSEEDIGWVFTSLERSEADVIGLNCSTGPSYMLDILQSVAASVRKPLSVMPNAGFPREFEGRQLYMASPDYFSEYALRFLEAGARVIGGCCGTTPDHIHKMAQTILTLGRAKRTVEIRRSPQEEAESRAAGASAVGAAEADTAGAGSAGAGAAGGGSAEAGAAGADSAAGGGSIGAVSTGAGCRSSAEREGPEALEPMPLAERSELGRALAEGSWITSVELVPPRGVSLDNVIEKARTLAEKQIACINIPDGPRASSRVSALVTAIEIHRATGVEPMPHLTCRDKNIIGIQSELLGAQAAGIQNLLLLTGDPPKVGNYPDASGVFDIDSIGLLSLAHNLNRGIDLAGKQLACPTSFVIGAGANPTAPILSKEIEHTFRKAEAGAEFFITQPVFDVALLEFFLEKIKPTGVPVIAGIWPLSSYRNALFLDNEVPGVSIPKEIQERMRRHTEKDAAIEEGILIAREIIEAIRPHIAGVQVSPPFGRLETALRVLEPAAGE